MRWIKLWNTASGSVTVGTTAAAAQIGINANQTVSFSPSGRVTFFVNRPDGSGSDEVPMPLYELSPENEQWLSREPRAVSSELQRAFRRLGRDVRTEKHFIPLETGDGQHVLIPVEQMEITPASGRSYQ